MNSIVPTITHKDQILLDESVPFDWDWRDLTVFETPYDEISLHRIGEPFGHFANTEFLLTGKNSKRLCIVIGESWCYGGKIREMNKDGTESAQSFTKAVTQTMGAWCAHLTDSDFYQNAFPGDNTSNMVRKAKNAVEKYSSQYEEILLLVQFTDVIRESGVYNSLPEWDHVRQYIDAWEQYNERMHFLTWLNHYETGYLQQLQDGCALPNVKICVWKNFTPWSLTLQQRKGFTKITTVDSCWLNYISEQEGYPVKMRYFNNPGCLDRSEENSFGNSIVISDIIIQEELERIERLHHYWDNVSPQRARMSIHYPSAHAHQSWALNIVKQANWFKEV